MIDREPPVDFSDLGVARPMKPILTNHKFHSIPYDNQRTVVSAGTAPTVNSRPLMNLLNVTKTSRNG